MDQSLPEVSATVLPEDLPLSTEQSLIAAHLFYADIRDPGIRRCCQGKNCSYLGPDGRSIRDPNVLARITALGIPPAWRNVWISPDPNGHIQATGVDARGRRQYRYHVRWSAVRQETKFHRMLAFGEALPRIRQRVAKDLAKPGLNHDKTVALVIRLMDLTAIRIGNDSYARDNKTFGLTTLRDRHVAVEGAEIRLHFRGKSGKEHEISLHDRRLARLIKQCQDLPGHELFQYRDEQGARRKVSSQDVNDYLQSASGQDITAKDFRTWAGTVLAVQALKGQVCEGTEVMRRKRLAEAVKLVSSHLGNTAAVCRKYYIHPCIFQAFQEGRLDDFCSVIEEADDQEAEALTREEREAMALIRRCNAQDAEH